VSERLQASLQTKADPIIVTILDLWKFKHWKCISKYDLESIQGRFSQDCFDIPSELSDEMQKVVLDTLKTGEVMEPPKPPTVVPKKSRKKQPAAEVDEPVTPKPKRGKKRAAPVRSESDSESEPEYVLRKTRSRAVEVVDPNVARIQAMAESMRAEAGR